MVSLEKQKIKNKMAIQIKEYEGKRKKVVNKIPLGDVKIGDYLQLNDVRLDFETDNPDTEEHEPLYRRTRPFDAKQGEDRVTIENVNNPEEIMTRDADRQVIPRDVIIQVKKPKKMVKAE